MHALSRCLGHGAHEGACAAFAVGARNMDHRRQALLRMIQLCQQILQPLEAEIDQPRMQSVEARDDAFDAGGHARCRSECP